MEKNILQSSVTILWGISKIQAGKLKKLGIDTIEDLLNHFPNRYCDYRKVMPIAGLQAGQEAVVIRGSVWQIEKKMTFKGTKIFLATVADQSGMIRCVWFNQLFLANSIKEGMEIFLAGKVENYRGFLSLLPVEHEVIKDPHAQSLHFNRIVPIYPETAGVSSKWLRHKINLALVYVNYFKEYLPEKTLQNHKLLNLIEAMKQVHFPSSPELAAKARERLAFEELFILQLRGLIRKKEWQKGKKAKREWPQEIILRFLQKLPFSLTDAQKRVLNEILKDIQSSFPMRRLLEGDVGSGKTVIAALAMLLVAKAGFQCALMVPTEILSEQHFYKIASLLAEFNLKIALVTSSKSLINSSNKLLEVEKVKPDELKRKISQGGVDIVIGTQSLREENMVFAKVGLVIIDEQQRFGVAQRADLHQKSKETPDFLMMSATPIPRSLALALYGDLDLSILDEMPKGRQKIISRIIPKDKKNLAYEFVRKKVQEGRQAFIICPLIEESEKITLKSAKQEYERLSKEVFPDLRVGLLHGRLKAFEKDQVMEKFLKRKFDILVSTTVIEVGIDIPNAVIMLIENAERFGLAQLHQLRGRVGRGDYQSYCLISTATNADKGLERLQIFVNSDNGFSIAEADLSVRGPGEVYGLKQSGFPDFRMASLTDYKLIEATRKEALRVLTEEKLEELPQLKNKLEKFAVKEVFLH